MRICWKACRVYFPMNVVATSFDTPYCLQTRISTDCSEGQQSAMTECWYNLLCKTVPIYNVSWYMAYIAGKLFEFSFTPKKLDDIAAALLSALLNLCASLFFLDL